MTKIHITIVAHSLHKELEELYSTLADARIFWHLFLHSDNKRVMQTCEEMAQSRNVYYYPYGTNRGLARSWNEGLHASRVMKADVCMIANDDVVADFADVWRIARAAQEHPEAYMVSGMGLDVATGARKDMLFALAAINPVAFDVLAHDDKLFDEQFEPIYYEDLDLYRRAELAGLKQICVQQTELKHLGSATRHAQNDEIQFWKNFGVNQARYIR